MVDKLAPIIQIAGENPELAPLIGTAYRGYQIVNGLAAIEEKLREEQKLEQDRLNIERQFANYTPQQGWSSTGGYIATRPNRTAATAAQSQSGTFIASRPTSSVETKEETFEDMWNRISNRIKEEQRVLAEQEQETKNEEQREQDRQLAQEELTRQNAELIRIANESKYRDQGPLYIDEEANLYRELAEEQRRIMLEEDEEKKRLNTIRIRVPSDPTGNTTDEKIDFYRNRVAAITAVGDVILDDADLSDTPFNITNPAGPRPRFQNGVGYTPILAGGLALVGGYLNRSIHEPNPFTPPNVQNPTYTLPPNGAPVQPPITPNPGPTATGGTTTPPIIIPPFPTIPFLVPPNTTPTIATDSNPITNPVGVVTNPIINPVVPIEALAPLVIVKENFVPRTISVAPSLAIGLAAGATLTTLLGISNTFFQSKRKKRKDTESTERTPSKKKNKKNKKL